MPGAAEALRFVRAHGVPVGVISNQSGVNRGFINLDQVHAVNARVTELLGPFDLWRICPHVAADGCDCRKPAPGMLLDAARSLDTAPASMVFIGDIGADIGAADAAGCRGILVPTAITLPAEVTAAETVAHDLMEAVRLALGIPGTGEAS